MSLQPNENSETEDMGKSTSHANIYYFNELCEKSGINIKLKKCNSFSECKDKLIVSDHLLERCGYRGDYKHKNIIFFDCSRTKVLR